MKTIFETCSPREEVLAGQIKEEIFMARLKDVIDGKADAVYQDATTFFDNTYPTAGLKTLLSEVLGRLTGVQPTSSAVVRLETAFGGGKTHNLIALYHLASRGAITRSLSCGQVNPTLLHEIIDESLFPKEQIQIAGIVGEDLDPENGVEHGEATTYTLWGEMAYQLRGVEGYRILEASDQKRIAPGTQVLEKLISDVPTLIMLDELAHYLRVAKGVVGKTSLAEQTVGFFKSLLEFAASKERVVVVFTLAERADAFGRETEELHHELGEAKRISARQERVITPTAETEIAPIVTHRLFKAIDESAAQEVADAYSKYFRHFINQNVDIAQRATRADYAQEIVTDYPFHPELLTTLNRKTATIPNFQKTRGALRLLAMVIRNLWNSKPPDAYLIHPYHLSLADSDIANDLTSRLERPRYRSVIEADIVSPLKGSVAHAEAIDDKWVQIGKPSYANRVATTIFLHSLTQGVASGVAPADMYLAVLQPEDDPAMIDRATESLIDDCWFLAWDGHRYRFTPEPQLPKVIADEMSLVGKVKAKEELDRRIRQIWKKGVFQPIYFPSEASEVDDDAQIPKLVVLHYDAATNDATAEVPPELVRKIFEHSGTLEGYRTYKNNLLFLVADNAQVERMVEVAQRYLAINRILSDRDRMNEFDDEQQKKLKGMQEASELDLRIAITKAYRYLYYPSADAQGNLARETLNPDEQGDVEKDQTAVLLRVLRQLDKVLTADDKPLAAAYVKAKAWKANQPMMSTEELNKAFSQRFGLRILLDVNKLKTTIRDGAKQGTWIYFDSAEQIGYGPPSPAPLVQISEDEVLYEPQEAKRVGIKIKGDEVDTDETCPVCGKPENECVCDEADGGDKAVRIHAEGAPAQVFQAILDQCHDNNISFLQRLFIRIEGMGKEAATDARALGVAIPQLGKGEYHIEQTMNAEFGDEEMFSLTFTGTWNRYKRVKQLTDAFGKEATKVSVKMTLRADFTDGLDVNGEEYQTIRDIFTTLGMGKLVVDAEPKEVSEQVGK